MAISITLTLPDEIFNLAQSLAHSINRDLNDILVEAIAFSISPNYQGEKISSLNSLSDEEIIKLTGTNQKVVYHPLPINDPLQRQPDISKAKELLGWEAKVGRAEGMKITYEYFKSLSPEELSKEEHKDFSNYIK